MKQTTQIIHLAGGCFWGLEKLMQSIPGVTSTISGYANGKGAELANYKAVCSGKTDFREAVRVEYDSQRISLDAILFAYFYVIDPTKKNQQGNDLGSQYQTGIYYSDDESQKIVERIVSIEKGRVKHFMVEVGPLINFYSAEEVHQNYLDKNPNGYCHIPIEEIKYFSKLTIDPGLYQKPAKEIIKDTLSEEQYRVTQTSGTEAPFTNEYWQFDQVGIYVDVVTGEPLFSSLDKYQSSCGWPAFKAPIEEPSVIKIDDYTHGMIRSEVRSRSGDSHLGHVFLNDHESPNGTRFCINSASLKFIPIHEMENAGYRYLLHLFK